MKDNLFDRRHFVAMAAIIDALGNDVQLTKEQVAAHFADKLAGTNPLFDRARFLNACRLTRPCETC